MEYKKIKEGFKLTLFSAYIIYSFLNGNISGIPNKLGLEKKIDEKRGSISVQSEINMDSLNYKIQFLEEK